MKISGEIIKHSINRKDLSNNSFQQFGNWLHEAIKAGVQDSTAMTLSTVSKEDKPSSRIVLLKEDSDKEFTFFTNYNNSRGQHLTTNSYAALNFYWSETRHQVRVEGVTEKLPTEVSYRFFLSRPYIIN